MKYYTSALFIACLAIAVPAYAQTAEGSNNATSAEVSNTGAGEPVESEGAKRRAAFDAWNAKFCPTPNAQNFCNTNGSIAGDQAD